ncbi:MAG: diacylglyceryl transferase [Flavobacteriaceae bacterium]|nr:diacylglyceryl transferase [Flavobacteriaceae bacterium]
MSSLKERWKITSNWQIVLILFVFSITGTSSLFVSKPIMKLLGITKENLHLIPYWILYIIIGLVFYKILLLSFGWMFGQFNFFWNFVSKTLRHIGFKRFFSE